MQTVRQQYQKIRFGVGQIGKRVTIEKDLSLLHPGLITLEDDVHVHRDVELFVHTDGDATRLRVGKRSWIGAHSTISVVEGVSIGESVIISPNVHIADHTHAYTEPGKPVMDQPLTAIQPVVIGDRCWIGRNTLIFPGVHVGEQVVIGANSIVKNDIPSFSVAAGCPAKVLKKYNPRTNAWISV